MHKLTIAMTFILAALMASQVSAGPNGGVADRYNEARSYPDKTVNDDSSEAVIRELEKLREEHEELKRAVMEQSGEK